MDNITDMLTDPRMLPIIIALAAGLAAYLLSRAAPALCKLLALAAAAGVLATGVALAVGGEPAEPFAPVFATLTSEISFTVDLASTPLGMVVVIGAAAFALLVSVYSLTAMAGRYWEGKFYAYLLWALAGAAIVALAGNLLVLLVGWELVTLMLFLMINQGRPGAKAGGMKAYAVLGFADAGLLLAVVLLLAMDGGSKNILLAGAARSVADMGATGYVVYVLMLMAAFAKAGAIPLHTWVPAIAKDTPTPVMAFLPAAVDKLLGIYLLAVVSLRLFRPDPTMQMVMMSVGAVTILSAVLMAMMQHNLKKLLGFHAVSQVGYMVLGIGTGTTIGVIGGLFHMINNAIYKSNLFLMSGAVSRAAGTDELEDMGGLARALPVTFACGIVSAAAISGIPLLNGFASKWLLYQSVLSIDSRALATVFVVVAVFGSALTLASFVKVIYSAFLSPAPRSAGADRPRAKEGLLMAAPMVVLAVGCIVLGLCPSLITQDVLAPAVGDFDLAGPALAADWRGGLAVEGQGSWRPTRAAGLLLLGLLLGVVLVLIVTRAKKARVVRPFLGGEIALAGDDRWRMPGTHFYETIAKLPVVGPLLAHGEAGAMDLYHWSGKHGHTFVDLLRRQHTGLLNLYVAWALLGMVATLLYLLVSMRT